MDIRSLKAYHDELHHELVRLKGDAFVKLKVPSIVRLVEMEVPRIYETLLSMKPNEVHSDKDGLMLMKSVTNVFDLRGSASVEVLKNKLIYELKVIELCFHPPPPRLCYFVSIAIHHMERQFPIELYAEKARGFSIVDSSQQQPDERVPCKNLEMWIDFAIEMKMDASPENFHGNQVMEILQRLSRMSVINVDDEDVKKLVIQKCNEAIESRNKKLAEEDQTKSCSKHE